MVSKKKIFTRNILLVSFISFFTDIASEMLYPIMPSFLRSIGFSFLLIGILESTVEFVSGFSKGYFGKMSDILGKRVPFIRSGYALSAISKPMMAAMTFPLWIFFARTIDRIGKGLRTGARDALLSDETTAGNKGKVFGLHRGMDSLGAAIGPFIAMAFLFYFPEHYREIFLIAFFPGLIAIFLTFVLKDNKDHGKKDLKNPFFSFVKYWKYASSDYKKTVIGLLAFTLFNSSDVFLLLVLKSTGMSDVSMIGYYVFYNVVYAVFSFPLGVLADKIGLKKILISGLILFVFVYSSISFVNNQAFFFAIFFIYGIYAASTEGISKALLSNLCSKDEVGTAIGFFTGFSSIIALIASSLFGLIWSVCNSPQPAFLFSSIGVTLVVVYLLITFRSRSPENI